MNALTVVEAMIILQTPRWKDKQCIFMDICDITE